MPTSAGLLARAVSEAVRARTAFEARQKIRAGSIHVEAHVRCLLPDRLLVEHETYTNPLADLEDLLGGNAEFAGSDLVGSSLSYDGKATCFLNTKTAVALRCAGRVLYEPIPGVDVLGETRFLDDLARDYLLRDNGDGNEAGRATRILGLKPKRARIASVLRVVAYPFDRADVAFDAETLFPLRIQFVPSPDLPIRTLLGPDPLVTIEYSDVRELDADETTFAPPCPAGTRIFEETRVAESELEGALPFPLPLDVLRRSGYELAGPRIQLVLDAAHERGYAAAACVQGSKGDQEKGAVVLRVGNYVSRHMARRRSFAAERGELVDVAGRSARLVDRRLALADLPPDAAESSLVDLTWESGGIFWVLTAEQVSREDLLALASALA